MIKSLLMHWDPVSQRKSLASLALVLGGWFLSDVVLHCMHVYQASCFDPWVPLSTLKDFTLLLKWVTVFNFTWLSLYWLQIPMWQLSGGRFITGILGISFILSLLFIPISPLSVRSLMNRMCDDQSLSLLDPTSSASSSSAAAAAILDDQDTHISGSFTVKIIPYSSAQLNPDNQSFCLPLRRSISSTATTAKSTGLVRIPVVVTGIPPWTLGYSLISHHLGNPPSNHTLVIEYEEESSTDNQSPDFLLPFISQPANWLINSVADSSGTGKEEAKKRVIYLDVNQPGRLHLDSLFDIKGPGAVQGSKETVVNICPEAFWDRWDGGDVDSKFEGKQRKKQKLIVDNVIQESELQPVRRDLCQHSNTSLSVLVFGVPPLDLTYLRRSGKKFFGNITTSSKEQPKDWAPAVDVNPLGPAKGFHVRLPQETLDDLNAVEYFITQIRDGNGLITSYTEMVDADHMTFHVHSLPRASLSCNPEQPLEALIHHERPDELIRLPETVVEVSGRDPPFKITYEHTDSQGKTHTHAIESQTKRSTIKLSEVGRYSLKSVSDSRCEGTVDLRVCEVIAVPPPTINIQSGFIETPCFGQIGFSFNIQLTGQGPWKVWYDMTYDKEETHRYSVVIKRHSDQLEIKPPNPGRYRVTFVQFQDSYYPSPIPIQGVSEEQSFHAPSSAQLVRHSKRLCMGDDAEVAMQLSGSGPWSLYYELVQGTRRIKVNMTDIKETMYKFNTPKLNQSGIYHVQFQSIRDMNGCETSLLMSPFDIEVVSQRPSAVFSMNGEVGADGSILVTMKEGTSVTVPVQLAGHPPWSVSLEKSVDGQKWKAFGAPMTFKQLSSSFVVKEPGYYRITEVSDSVCKGTVGASSRLHVTSIPKPLLELVQIGDQPFEEYRNMKNPYVCQFVEKKAKVVFRGQPPYSLTYRIHDVAKSAKTASSEKVSLAQSTAWIDLPSEVPGSFEYTLESVADANYEQGVHIQPPIKFTHHVHALPSAKFLNPQSQQICLGHQLKSKQKVDIELSGNGPWKLDYEVSLRESSGSLHVLEEASLTVPSSPFSFLPLNKFKETGRHVYRLKRVEDAFGCASDIGESSKLYEVQVISEPSIQILSSGDSCIGDTLMLQFQGHSPWKLVYDYDMKPENGGVAEKMKEQEIMVDARGSQSSWPTEQFRKMIVSSSSSHLPDTETGTDGSIARIVSLIMKRVGSIVLKRICHNSSPGDSSNKEDGWCCRELSGMQHTIHPYPSAAINSGQHATDVIREGNEAVVRIDFKGVPPYSFTYARRSEITGAELDSVTIGNITDAYYDLSVAQAGTFRITSISDRHCRYPPIKKPVKAQRNA